MDLILKDGYEHLDNFPEIPPTPFPRINIPKGKEKNYLNIFMLYERARHSRVGKKINGKVYPGTWASTKGKVYKEEDTGFLPTIDEISILKDLGFIMKGKIVCGEGKVYNADMENMKNEYLKNLDLFDRDTSELSHTLNELFTCHKKIDEKWIGKYPSGVRIGMWTKIDNFHQFPIGDYNREVLENRNDFSICDNEKCSFLSHVLVDGLDRGWIKKNRDKININDVINYLKRPIYTKTNLEDGNFNLCFMCISKNFLKN